MPRGRPRHPDILTPREWQVLDLLREGLTNEQIGQRLGISENGAKYHVLEIYSKLGVSNRREAAAWQREPATASRQFAGLAALFALRPSKLGAINTSKAAMTVLAITVFGFLGLLAAGVLVMDQRSASDTTPGNDGQAVAPTTQTPTVTATPTLVPEDSGQQVTGTGLQPRSTPTPTPTEALSSTGQFMASLPDSVIEALEDFADEEGSRYDGPCSRSTEDGELCMFNITPSPDGKTMDIELEAWGESLYYGITMVPDGDGGYRIDSSSGPEATRPEFD